MADDPRALPLFLFLLAAFPSYAQTSDDASTIRALEEDLARQKEALARLEAELERLKTAGTDEALETAEAAPTPVPTSVEIAGYANVDLIYDFDRVAPEYDATLVPTTIPTVPGQYGSDGNFIASVKQTKLSITSRGQTPLGAASALFEFDLFGTGSDAGATTFNLRHAWIELGNWGIGQTWTTFMDISTWPNVYDWWGPSAMALNRNVQLRYTFPQAIGGGQLALALEKQNGSFNVDPLNALAPALAESVSTKSELPDLIARWRLERDWGHFQAAAVLRKLSYETLLTPNNNPSGDETGWGLNLTGIINTVGRDQLKLGLTFGEGIASFINDGGGSNLALDSEGAGIDVVTTDSVGFLLYYDHYWSDEWSSSIGFSQNDNDLTSVQVDEEPDKVSYASTNLFYTASPAFALGLEALYGKLDVGNGSSGSDFRIQFTARYNFSHRIDTR